jgi:cytochrome b6
MDERYGVGGIAQFLKKKTVPEHKHSFWYYMGGMTMFLFFFQIITGIMLLFYYSPGIDSSYESVRRLITQVPFGWFVRSVHAWGATLMIALGFVHLFSVFILKAYRPPRELTWITGILCFGIALFFGFSGYLLPWTELSVFATKVGTEIAGAVPVIGDYIMKFLRSGEDVTGDTITRFFAIHVGILPLAMFAVLGIHLILIQKQGMSVPVSIEKQGKPVKQIPFVPDFFLKDLMAWLIIFAAVIVLAMIHPWHLGKKADLFAAAPSGIRPEWYFLFMFETLKILPSQILFFTGKTVGVMAIVIGAVLLTFLPFLDRKSARNEESRAFTWIAILLMIYIVVFSILGHRH